MFLPSFVVLGVEQLLYDREPLARTIESVVKNFKLVRALPRSHIAGLFALNTFEDDMSVRDEVVARAFLHDGTRRVG